MSTPTDAAQELMRSVHADEIEATVEVLSLAGIEHQVVSTQSEAEGAEAAFLGLASESVAQAVMVRSGDLELARAALEKAYSDAELPEGHFLLTAVDAEVAEVLLSPKDWSAFDVTQARKLAATRGIDLSSAASAQKETKARLAKGKPATLWVLGLAWAAIPISIYLSYNWGNDWKSNLGCIIAAVIGETYANSCLEDDTTHVYDKQSRQHGRLLTVLAVLTVLIMRYVVTSP